jgi:hypothetical protein
MKQKVVFLACVVFAAGLAGGCGQQGAEKAKGPLPAFVTGTWQEKSSGDWPWRITIEPNGIVSSAITPFIGVEVRPNQTTKMDMADGNVSTFAAGSMFAEYTPATRELYVYIEMKEFHIRFFDIRTNGSRIDRLYGPVSEDGLVWKPDYIDLIDLGPELPMDMNLAEATPLIFDKVIEKPETGK